MQKLKMNRKARIMAIVLLGVLAASFATYAAIQYRSQVPNTGMIQGYELVLWNSKTNTAVTNIAWGNILKGVNVTTEGVLGLTQQLWFKNTGDFLIYPAWNLSASTPLPNNITLTCEYYGGTSTWLNFPQNTYMALNANVGALSNFPIRFTLAVPIDAPRGPLAFTVNLVGADTQSG